MILIRHGITQGNKEKRFVGRLDVPLAPEGEAPQSRRCGANGTGCRKENAGRA